MFFKFETKNYIKLKVDINYYLIIMKFIIFSINFLVTILFNNYLYNSINIKNNINLKDMNYIYKKLNNYIIICNTKTVININNKISLNPKVSIIIPI